MTYEYVTKSRATMATDLPRVECHENKIPNSSALALMHMAVEACSEITEGLLLYTSLQLNHLSRNSVKQLNPQLRLWVEYLARDNIKSNEAPHRECQVQILASGLGCYYLDGTSFLNTLCEHGASFKYCLSSSIISDVQLLCRCIGEHSTVTCCKLQNIAVASPTFQENVIPRPSHFNPATILIVFKVNLSKEQLTKLLARLHLMHITSPEITCSLECADAQCTLHFPAESFKRCAKTHIVTSLSHFYSKHSSVPVRQLKLRLLKGDAYTIPACVSLANGTKVTLKVYCTASVVPHLALRNGKKIPANRLCKYIHICVFGPSHLPLVAAGSQPNFPLASLAEWDSYGMELRQSQSISENDDHATVTPSYICEISNVRTRPSTTAPRSNSSLPTDHHLQLFIFLDDTTQDSGLGKNSQWKQSMELHHKLRRQFQSLVVDQSKKFQQAVHSALNKLICNYGTHAKTKSIMATAIPLISDAVASILKHSTNESFKEGCREIMQVEAGESVFSGWIGERLWKAAKDKLGVSLPIDSPTPNPDEPTSPELILAAGEHSNMESSSQTKTAKSANHMPEEQNDTRISILDENSQTVLPDLYQQETGNSSQSSLFLARIASNLAKSQQQTGIENYTESSEDIDFEALSNFEDLSQQDSATSDSDETVVSDFDELEGVSEGELVFSDQSHPPSPLLVGSSKATLLLNTHDHENPHMSLKVAVDRTSAIPMDTSCEDIANFDKRNCCGDEDNAVGSPEIVCQNVNSLSNLTSSQTQSICTLDNGDDLITDLPDLECEQHIPGAHEQAKEPKEEWDINNDSMSHLSDREWTEMSFESPVFVQGGDGSNGWIHSTQCCNNIGTGTQQCTAPTVGHSESCKLVKSTDLENNSAFNSLEDYTDTLSQDDSICIDTLVIQASYNSTEWTDTHGNGLVCEGDGAVVRGAASALVTDSPLNHDITDEDFCWED